MRSYTRAEVIGLQVRVPAITSGRGWWVTVRDVSDCGKYLKVSGGKMAGKPRWVPVTQCITGWDRKPFQLQLT